MSREQALLDIVHGKRNDPGAKVARLMLAALAQVYTAGLELFLTPYRWGLREQTKLGCPVISVGNITTGGTGKTPFTVMLVRLLLEEGHSVCVLNRGYRGTNEHGSAIVSNREEILLNPEAAGDEAWLLAKALPGVPVVVGKDRRTTGMLAVDTFHPDVVVLDDGLQYYQLHRDLDIGLVDALNPFDNGWTFPRGLLREPPSHLGRCRVIAITNCDKVDPEKPAELAEFLRSMLGDRLILKAQTRVREVEEFGTGVLISPKDLAGQQVVTACALGNPEAFEKQVAGLGAQVVERFRLEDHAAFDSQWLEECMRRAVSLGATQMVTTEKDAVKLIDPPKILPIQVLKIGTVADDVPLLRAAMRMAARR